MHMMRELMALKGKKHLESSCMQILKSFLGINFFWFELNMLSSFGNCQPYEMKIQEWIINCIIFTKNSNFKIKNHLYRLQMTRSQVPSWI